MIGGEAVALAIEITATAREANAEIDSASEHVSKLGRAGSIAGKVLAVGLLAAGAAAVDCAKDATALAANQSALADAAKKVAGASDEQVTSMQEWIETQGKLKGVTSTELYPALTKLVNATHDVGKAQSLTTLAMDISARTHKSLDSVVQKLSKSYTTGSVAALAAYQVKTKDAAGHTLALSQVTKELAETYNGAAAKAADTAAGKQRILSVETEQLKEKIGTGLLPVEGKLLAILLTVASAMSNHATTTVAAVGAFLGLLAVIKLVSLAQGAYTAVMGVYAAVTGEATAETLAQKAAVLAASAATKAYTVAQIALDAAMDANPIGLIVLAIAALVAGLILAYKHSETFRAIVDGAFKAVSKAAGAAVDFIREHWKLILGILTGPIGVAVIQIAAHWSQIQAGGAAVIAWVRGKWSDLKGLITSPFTEAQSAVGKVWGKITGAFDTAYNTLSGTAAKVQSAVGGAFNAIATSVQTVIDKVQGVIDKIAALAHAASGIHLPGFGRTSVSGAGSSAYDGPRGAPGGSTDRGGVTMTVNFNGVVGDPSAVARQLDQLMRRYKVSARGAAIGA